MPSFSPLESSTDQSLLYRFIRIYPHELGRTSVIWIIRFLYRFVFVLSWTLIVAQVSSAFHGELSLPILFLFHAVLVFAGSITSYFLFQHFELEYVFLTSLLVGAGLLFGVQFLHVSDMVRIGVLLFVESSILVQLSINIETFTERLFTPLESSRTFPVVESGDTVATLCAGLVLFLNAQTLTPSRVIWIVTGVLALLVPLFLQYHSFIRSLPGLCLYRKQLLGHGEKHDKHHDKKSEQILDLNTAKKQPYIRLLVLIVLSQWFFAVILEFLFTYSISSQFIQHPELVPAASGAVENVLVHEFGLLQIFFAVATLFSHFFLAGRCISNLGVVGSMILYPIVSLLGLAGMVVNFNYFTTVLSRMNAEVVGVIFRNAYQSSYYVFEEAKSQFVRIILDGVIRPIGSLFGTLFLLLSFYVVSSHYYIMAVLVGAFFVLLVFLIATLGVQRYYTQQVISQIKDSETDIDLKLSLLDVLAQKGHEHIYPFLQSLYASDKQPPLVKMKLIQIFSHEQDFLSDILTGLSHEDFSVRFASLEALISMEKRGFFKRQLLSTEFVITTLKRCYVRESHQDLRYMMLLFLATFKEKEVLDFLLDLLHSEAADSLGEVLQACDVFNDPSFVVYFQQFLGSSDPRVWASAAICLSKHAAYENQVLELLRSHLHSDSAVVRRALSFVLAETSHSNFQSYIESRVVETSDLREKMLLAFALVKTGLPLGFQIFFDMIFHPDHHVAHQARRLIHHLPPTLQHHIDSMIQHRSLANLHHFLKRVSGRDLIDLSLDELHYLRDAYTLLNVTEEIIEVDYVIQKKDPFYRRDISHFGFLPLTPSVYV